ncbi:hypothetical protein BDN70DRAFT_916357 [Pholiota conissans]|uniref:Uncharacterized protein n=1 Tax=Pholiota conissans TaxID=109636 RepID=A0A9P5ZEA7_9AGAR|nr:hypothetical protein BDN70DRAFT_916357 [Pholiota conissans]
MSLRSDPTTKPDRPDPVTRNQPEMEKINTNERTGTEHMPGNYPLSRNDTTSSGGYGSQPDQLWSNKAQRGIDMPTTPDELNEQEDMPDNGLIDQTADGTNLKNELQDAKQGRDAVALENEDEWGVEKGADKDF